MTSQEVRPHLLESAIHPRVAELAQSLQVGYAEILSQSSPTRSVE